MNPVIMNMGVAIKNISYIPAFMIGTAYLGLTPESVVILMALIIFDIITGLLKSYLLQGGSSIKSSILERGLIAKALIICIPLNLALVGKGVGFDISSIAQGTIDVLILSELYSILGNYYAIRTGEERVEFDAVAYIVAQLKKLLKSFIQD